MVSLLQYSLLLSLFLSSSLADSLTRPIIVPEMPSLNEGILENLAPNPSIITPWSPGLIPSDCKTLAAGQNLTATDFDVFDVAFPDCPTPWTMCRHHESPISQATMVDWVSRLPVRMRGLVRHLVSIPGVTQAFGEDNNIVLFGDWRMDVLVHEVGHCLDGAIGTLVTGPGTEFHGMSCASVRDEKTSTNCNPPDSDPWLSAYNSDSAISDTYAATSQAENVAQETVIALFNTVVPGGLASVQPSWASIDHMYSTLQTYAGNIIQPGGVCAGRLPNSAIVSMADSAKFRTR